MAKYIYFVNVRSLGNNKSSRKKKSSFTCDYLYNRKIFTNVGTSDYIRKVTSDDLWNHSNFIRIIKFKKQKKIILKNPINHI